MIKDPFMVWSLCVKGHFIVNNQHTGGPGFTALEIISIPSTVIYAIPATAVESISCFTKAEFKPTV